MSIVFALLSFIPLVLSNPLPVVLWHGMGDSCCNPFSMGHLKRAIEQETNGTYVVSIRIGNNVVEDTENGYLMPANPQVELVCKQLLADKKLASGYNAIGLSQGGQFLRAVAQRCPNPPMKTLVSLGGQHQGVFGLPHCDGETSRICEYVRRLLTYGAYESFVQNHITQAGYWHDPLREALYAKKSVFLADLNQEQGVKPEYRVNLASLRRLVLVMFLNDTMVEPKESSWFGFYKANQTRELYSMQESDLYTQDLLGLRTLDQRGAIHLDSVEGDHLQFSISWFNEHIIRKYLLD